MSEINTIIQLRNDTAENWATEAGQATPLKPGEVAVEVVNGKAKLKIGTSDDSTFGNSEYFGSDVKLAQVYQSENLTKDSEQDDITVIESLIPEGTEVQNGDIAIVKRYINGVSGAVSHTSYVYDSDLGWAATDGNYSASNVFTKNDITLTSALGNYAKDKTLSAGTSLEEILSGLFQKEEEPGTPTKPSASISVSGATGEVGTEYTVPTAKLNIGGVGSYTYGPATGIVFNIGDVKLAEGAEPTTATNYVTNDTAISAKKDNALSLKATGDTVKYTDSSVSYTFSASASYQAATTSPVTNLGNPSKTQSAIAAGSCTIADQTATFTGWRRMFMGAVSKTAELNSETIKTATLISEKAVKSTAKEFTAPVGTEKLIIAYPRTLSTKAPTVQYFTMSWEDFGDFSLAVEKVKVADASGAFLAETDTNDEYIVYAYTPADPLKADTKFKVTLN